MSLLYLDCIAGIAGDMMLGLLLDLGLSLDALRSDLALLPVTGYRIEAERIRVQGIAAIRAHIIVHEDPNAAQMAHLHAHNPDEHQRDNAHKHAHPHPQGAGHHQHPHEHSEDRPSEAGSGHGPAMALADIEHLIEHSELPNTVKTRALRIFQVLGEAEAKVHGVPLEHIHFHEVGAIDSIVDIVGTAIGIDRLGITDVVASPVPVGSGFVEVAHGRMPVPTPAAAELLRGVPTYNAGISGEMVTPTGAAILKALVRNFGDQPPMRVDRIGYGAGTRDFSPLPNAVRGFLGESEIAAPGMSGDEVWVLETTVDDMLPEHLGYALDRLLAAGALDVFFTPVQGKKNRPATLVTALTRDETHSRILRLLFEETTTFGVRQRKERRVILDREFVEVTTPWGPIAVKIGRQNGEVLTLAPEFDACKRLAEQSGVPLRSVYDHAKQQAMRQVEGTS